MLQNKILIFSTMAFLELILVKIGQNLTLVKKNKTAFIIG